MDTKKLRQKILDLAIRGKLVPQDPNDEPASVLIEKIRAEKEQLIKEKKIKRDKNESHIYRSDKSYYEKFADGTVKCIDEEIPFEIPESWEWCRLGNLCDYGVCINVSPTAIADDAWVLDLEDIEKDTAKLLQRIRKADRKTTSSRHFFSKGNVLYSKLRTYLNKVMIADIDGFSTTEILLLDFKGFVIPEYARHVLMSKMFLDYTAQCGYGVKMPRLGTNDGKKALFPLPTYSEQKQIVFEIEHLFSLVGTVEENKISLEQFIAQIKSKILDLAIRGKLVPQDPNDEPASVLLERIKAEHPESKKKIKKTGDNSHYPFDIPRGWEWSRLGRVASYKKGPFGSSITKSMFIPDSTNAIKVYEQKNAIYKDSNLGNYYISEAKFEKLKGFQVFPKDILVSCAGTIGETYVMPQNIRKGIINQALMRIKLYNYEMLDFYLMYFDFVLKNQANEQGKGTAIKNIPPFDILKNFLIPLPPLSEQKRIIKKIEEIFAQLDEIADSIKA